MSENSSPPSLKALFLDRDGVININHGYVSRPEQVDWLPGIFDLVKRANKANYLVIIVTNQSGIARGYYSEATFWSLMNWMQEEFAKQGANIDKIYYCPHHPSEGQAPYLVQCDCRKPSVGMIEQALQDYAIDLEHSIMVGDKRLDMEMAVSAKIAKGYLLTKSTPQDLPNSDFSEIKLIEHLNLVQIN